MRLDKFTERAQEAVLEAQERARGANHSQTEPEHLLYALLEQRDGVASEILRRLGVEPGGLTAQERPEFLSRVDEIIIFHSLSKEQLVEIVEIQIRRLAERLREQKIELELTEAAKRHLAEVGYDPVYGARPLKRAIQNELADPLAKEILEGRFGEGDMVEVDI